jgi:hypothetical protein
MCSQRSLGAKSGRRTPAGVPSAPTQAYELLLFSGQSMLLADVPILDPLMEYLQQAYHVNAMIGRFEQLDGGEGNTRIRAQRYTVQIGECCQYAIPAILERFETSLKSSSQ